jgi:cell division protein FtsL
MGRYRKKTGYAVIKSLNDVSSNVEKGSYLVVTVIIFVLVALLLLGYIGQKVKVNQLKIEVEQFKKESDLLAEQNEKKRAQVLLLLNESRIMNIAENKLNMTIPPLKSVAIPKDIRKKERIVNNIFEKDL